MSQGAVVQRLLAPVRCQRRSHNHLRCAPTRCDASGTLEQQAPRARLVCITGEKPSPYREPEAYGGGAVAWSVAAAHLCERLQWTEPSFRARCVSADALLHGTPEERARCAAELADADLVAFVGVEEEAAAVAPYAAAAPCLIAHDCAALLARQQRLHFQPASALAAALSAALPWSRANRDALLLEQAAELLRRNLPNDFVFALLLLCDAAVAPVTTLTVSKRTGLGTLACMAQHCRDEVLECVGDTQCKAALDCLTDCGLNDQVCSYRCIVSYESPKFEAFSLCVLQKHNCLGNSASRPLLPAIQPMASFRGAPLTHETAESLLVGWLRGAESASLSPPDAQLSWSWKVVAGQNPAFDHVRFSLAPAPLPALTPPPQFPAQHQLWYRTGRSMWCGVVRAMRERRSRRSAGTTPCSKCGLWRAAGSGGGGTTA